MSAEPSRSVRVLTDHEIPERAPFRIAPGDRVTVGEQDTEWPAFVMVMGLTGEGWVPSRHLSDERPIATVISAYDTQELPASAGDVLALLADDPESGWSWCRNAAGRGGWVPHRALDVH
ncbi:SH3 domain-containing protein [Demequina sp. NBRC 110055]|uniref:SH3 domain-containing protein n=1 Tax=Demequina sp. NBRC 110055 TaxID=1570344 RepID=UPI001F27AE1B|nr:SH3 domain-containing protein [Demequina sp. NBRC 110055]